ncbi:MAG: hypothetical protein IJN76_03320 [Clostridia bacterium]|nr:hypothetical protein [Clostridia bacterium]
MFDIKMISTQTWLKGMTWTGLAVTVLAVVLRLWLMPAAEDWQTGLFTSNYWVIGLMLLTLALLLVMRYFAGPLRREINGTPSVAMALALLLSGAVMTVFGVLDVIELIGAWDGVAAGGMQRILLALQYGFSVLGGLALVRFGWALLTEGGTRRGIAQWSILAPVLWAWFRLVGYEMDYASMVRIEDNFFGFVMLIVELLFLFRLARYASGIGRVSAGSLMWHSMATAIFAISGPVVRLGMYLLQDKSAFDAYRLAGPTDLVVGVLALVVGISLLYGEEPGVQEDPLSEVLDKEAAEAVDLASSDLLLGDVDADGE